VEQYNAEARGLCNYYNLACDYHTLDYFCYLMEYSCLKTIANKHKSSIRKIIRQYRDGKTWSVPYETKSGTKRGSFTRSQTLRAFITSARARLNFGLNLTVPGSMPRLRLKTRRRKCAFGWFSS